jgi:hypothetical protein
VTVEERLNAGARRLEEFIDADFLTFQDALLRKFPDLTVGEFAAITGAYAAHSEQVRRRFLQRFHDALNP